MTKYIAVLTAAITAGAMEAGSQGLITEHLAAGVAALAAGILTEIARRMRAPEKGPGVGPVSLLLIVALTLTGCGLFSRVSSFLGAQCDEYCDEAAVMFDLLCGRAEAKARGRSFDGVEQSRDFIDDVCRSEEAVQTYWPIVEQMIDRGELRASRAAHARAEARRAERSE